MLPRLVAVLCLFSSVYGSCPPGTTYNNNFQKCYKYISQPATFLLAEKSCESAGGSLVTIASAFENSFISTNSTISSTNSWIGLNLLMSTQWTWVNGDTSTYLNWAPGQPMDPSADQCAALRNSDNLWTKELCNSMKPYICQIDPYAVLPTTPATTAGCPDGHCPHPSYTSNPDTCKCYKVYPDLGVNYTDAAQICLQEGGTLAIVLSPADNLFIANLTRSISPDAKFPWIGLSCTGDSVSTCFWVDGTPVDYINLAGPPRPNEPIYMNEFNGMWYSSNLGSAFVCQTKGVRSSRLSSSSGVHPKKAG